MMLLLFLSFAASCLASCLPVAFVHPYAKRQFRKLIHYHSLSQSGTSSQIKTSSQSGTPSQIKTSSQSGSSSTSKTSSSTSVSSQSTTFSQSVSSVSACAVTAFNVNVNGCTQHAATVTATSYTDCGGCTMTTDYLPGPAMVCDMEIVRYTSRLTEDKMCMKMTTATDTTTTTALVCAPTPSCTKAVLPTFATASSATCTSYISTITQTVTTACGGYPGCAVVTEAMGHGLVSRISIPHVGLYGYMI